jgi:hypothetical protein
MNGATVASTQPAPVTAAGWVLAGVGDFNGDGHADLLWRSGETLQIRPSTGSSS